MCCIPRFHWLRAKTRAVGADNEAALAEDNLDNILGLPLTTALTLQDHRLPFQAYTLSLQESTQYALTYRPEVLQAALAVQKAATYMALAKADNRPTAGIRFTQAWNDTAFPGTKHKTWSLGGQISYRFYDGGAGKHKISQARQDLNIAGEIEQKTRDGVQLQVKQAYLAVRSAAQRVRETQAAVTQAAEGFAISRVRYEAGVGINLDVLDAQLALNQAKINHIQALYDYNVGISSLEQAMGMDVRSGVVRP
ncbi:MAG: TolC family protein [Megasphaera lornae]